MVSAGKTHVALLFGGQSNEHEISCLSAGTIDKALDREKYEVYRIYITKKGLWRYYDADPASLDPADQAQMRKVLAMPEAEILPGAQTPSLLLKTASGWEEKPLDIAFPVLHGRGGEDGTIQGLFEIARLKYVGCGVLSSAVSMDKIATKRMVSPLGIRQAKFIPVIGREAKDLDTIDEKIRKELGYPVFVKPANSGSTVGITQAHDKAELREALKVAGAVDSRILIEETIVGREIECAVMGNVPPSSLSADPSTKDPDEVRAAGVGEILSAESFYTYEAKYHNPQSRTVVDPDLPAETVEEIRRDACAIFGAVDGHGLARVDFFVEKATGQVVFNELNTMPGFTSISMYPMLWAQRGMSLEQQVDRLIRLGLSR